MTDLQRRQGELVEDTARRITEVPATRTDEELAAVANRRVEGRAMYDPLRGETVQLTPRLRDSLNTPAGQDAAEATMRSLRTRRRNPELQLDDVVDSFDFWHDYQQVLRDMAKKRSASTTPLTGPEARVIGEMRDEVMTDLFGQQNWGLNYADATRRFRENSEIIEALTDSEKFAKLSRDKLKAAVSKLDTDEERAAFAAGVVNDMIEKALTTGDETGNVARAFIKSPALREKLGIVLGPEKMDELEDAMRRLSKIAESRGVILGNSATAERQARQARIGEEASVRASAARSALNMQLGDAFAQALGFGGMKTVPPKVADQMLDMARSMTPSQLAETLAKLEGQSGNINMGLGVLTGAANAGIH
jgi:hypothetical protein